MTRGLGCACASRPATETEHAKRTNIRIPIRLMDILLVVILFCPIGLRKGGPRPKRGPDGLRGKNCHTRGEMFVYYCIKYYFIFIYIFFFIFLKNIFNNKIYIFKISKNPNISTIFFFFM